MEVFVVSEVYPWGEQSKVLDVFSDFDKAKELCNNLTIEHLMQEYRGWSPDTMKELIKEYKGQEKVHYDNTFNENDNSCYNVGIEIEERDKYYIYRTITKKEIR